MPRFYVHDTFALDEATFVLAGSVVEGKIREGMNLSLPFSERIQVRAAIGRLEFVRRAEGEFVALCFDCAKPGEIQLWGALELKGRLLEVN